MFQQITELGVRGLAVLLTLRGNGLVQSREIGARLGVSAAYVTKAFQPLARNGWLRSTRGRKGGWELIVDPHSITLAEIVLALEPDEQWRKCVMGHTVCSDENGCPFHQVWGDSRDRFAAVMEATTLADLEWFAPLGSADSGSTSGD